MLSERTGGCLMPTYCAMCPDWQIKNPQRCSNTLEEDGKTVYFCTARCKERFLRRTKPIASSTRARGR